MLGKRPHQMMQRSTSMSQLRAAPPDNFTQKVKGTPSFSPGPVNNNKAAATSTDPKAQDGGQGSVITTPWLAKHARQAKPFVHEHKDVPMPPCYNVHKATVKSFLDACHYCKRPLGQGRDIFIYRGDVAFCTEDCRFTQISNDERRLHSSILTSQQCSLKKKSMGTSK